MEITPEAIVDKHPVVEVAEGVEVGGFTVYAKMYVPEHKYSTGLYLVRILEPVALQYLQYEQGSLMENFRSTPWMRLALGQG
jgi:hypothetical protein